VHRLTFASVSEAGRRERNEDKLRVSRDGVRWVAVLADGAGGHRDGALASRRAVDCIEHVLRDADSFDAATLTHALLVAHANVQADAPSADRMLTTAVVLWIDEREGLALWSHVGDSRLYRVRGGQVDLMTRDDSVVQRMVDAGLLTPAQARVHPQRHHLMSALGIDDEVEPHTLPEAHVLQPGDAYLLCSDGWWGPVGAAGIAASRVGCDSATTWLDTMQRDIDAREEADQDNFSAIAVWVG
jgi:PPM family protein phosphatase